MMRRIIKADSKYTLIELLRLDVLRFYYLSYGNEDQPPQGLRLWLCLLSTRVAPTLLHRLSHFFFLRRLGVIAKLFSSCNAVLFGIEIASSCQIGPGLFLPHTQGTVLGAWSIGSNVTIFQGVTLGARSLDFNPKPATRPTIGNGVTIGAGAKVLGGIVLGDNCRVGANSVVLSDIPSGSLAVGVPARVILNS
ncbi:serine O-acetyltransferase [Synechococcus lacustris]|uniref:Serine acetyltransferase n=1 Tax=Synechococcus lacustris str. Tous TaxID=1910958 RepID=A0A2P7EBJ6_9SYNE|nr:serine O-acetyltransferase [Synechococcus lacustris]PSI00568.1 serine acetyltransferase [Synechococcus lacustris str. Tous]